MSETLIQMLSKLTPGQIATVRLLSKESHRIDFEWHKKTVKNPKILQIMEVLEQIHREKCINNQ